MILLRTRIKYFVSTHDNTNMTCGYVWLRLSFIIPVAHPLQIRVGNPDFTVQFLLHHLERSAGLARHPLLLMTIQAEVVSLMMREDVQKVNGLIGAIEKQTGYVTLNHLQIGSATRSLTELNLDLSKVSQLLGGAVWGLTDLRNLCDLIHKWMDQTAQQEECTEILEERLDVVVSKIRSFRNMTDRFSREAGSDPTKHSR